MGGRKHRMREKNKGRNGAEEVWDGDEKREVQEKHRGPKYNVDFQELNEDLRSLEVGEGQTRESEGTFHSDEKQEVEETEGEVMDEDRSLCESGGDREAVALGIGTNEASIDERIEVGEITSGSGFVISDCGDFPNKDTQEVGGVQTMTPMAMPQTPGRHRVLDEDRGDVVMKRTGATSSRMVINRYPGHLFIHIDQIERFVASRDDVEAVSVRVESKVFSYETKKYRPGPTIGINETLRIPIERMESLGFGMRLVLQLHRRTTGMFSRQEVAKTCEIRMEIDSSRIQSIHNSLVEHVQRWDHYSSRNIFKNLRNLFTNGATDAWSLKTYMSFISDDELQLIPAPLPHDLRSLSKWLVVKKFSYNMWFKGFVNVRGDLGNVCTKLWKRRYVKCYGYIIFVFNEHSRSLVGTINLVDGSFDPDVQNKVYSENFLRMGVGVHSVELHFDTREKYRACRSMLGSMLPRSLFSGGR